MGGEEGAFDFSPAGRRFAFMATEHIVGHASEVCVCPAVDTGGGSSLPSFPCNGSDCNCRVTGGSVNPVAGIRCFLESCLWNARAAVVRQPLW